MKEEIRAFIYITAISNAIDFEGKANPRALLGRVIPKFPELKSDMNSLLSNINSIVDEVNNMSLDEQKKEFSKLGKDIIQTKTPKKEKDGLPNLANTQDGVVVRFPPAPSGYLHLGHLVGIVANYEFKKKYGGKFILRFEDTNPDNIKLENYQKVIDDVMWVCEGDVDEICYQSDRIDLYYKYLRELFEKKQCYVCNCTSEDFKKLTDAKEECPHRKLSFSEQKNLFEEFMKGEIEGVVRAKAEINNSNPALRSFALARINKTPHPRVGNKYKVWPNYNLAVTVDDYLMELTHVIRGKDLEIGELRQKYLAKSLGWEMPIYFHFGRLNFIDVELSKTKLSEKIEEGIFTGWDDPRVPSLISHRKRGYKPQAFRKLILKQGISKRDSKITKDEYYKALDFFNKEILEEESNRAFCVKDPVILEIENYEEIPFKTFEMLKHPNKEENGKRQFNVEKHYMIEQEDFDKLEEKDTFRLMHFANFEIITKTKDKMLVKYLSREYDKSMKLKSNIHFVSKNSEQIILILPNNTKVKALCEKLGNLKEDTSLQFERYAFVKFDRIEENKKVFYYTHR